MPQDFLPNRSQPTSKYADTHPGAGPSGLGGTVQDGTTIEWLSLLAGKFPEQVVLLDPTLSAVAAVALGLSRTDRPGPCWLCIAHAEAPSLKALWQDLHVHQFNGDSLFYRGNLLQISRDLGIAPSLVYARESLIDPYSVQHALTPGSHLLVYPTLDGEASGVERCATLGLIELLESNGSARLFRSSGLCRGNGIRLSKKTFSALRDLLHKRYFADGPDTAPTPIHDLTAVARRAWLEGSEVGACGYGIWPYVRPSADELPATLPGGAEWPKISIVTPSFNQGQYIEQTILSVMNQGYPKVEHIVIDGGSTDATLGILEKYRGALAYVVSERDKGQSHAINKGMGRATGEIVTWLNSDDMLAPGALSAMALAFHTSNADMVAGICRVYADGVLEDQHLTSCPNGPLPLEDLLDLDGCWNQGQFFYQPEVMFKRSLWDRAGGRVDEDLYYSMDYELWLRFAEAGARLHVIGRPIAWFRRHADQKTHVAARFQKELAQFRTAYLQRTRRELQPKSKPASSRRRLRIVALNDHGFKYGAGIAHKRLAQALASAGHELFPICLGTDPVQEREDRTYSNFDVLESVRAARPDLVVVGNIHSARPDLELLQLLADRFPTAFVLHDFWLITGRCGYPSDCTKFYGGCDEKCPTPNEYPQLRASEIAGAWKTKQAFLRNSAPLLLANSQWTADYVSQALAGGQTGNSARIETIQLSFDLDTFHPLDRKLCRETLGLPPDKFIILMTSEFNDPRKGAKVLLDALNELRLPNSLLVSTSHSLPDPELVRGLDIRTLGYVDDPERLAMIYSAADLFVSTSREETFGQTYIEAIACGTPVLGFDVAGVKEAIMDGVTGRRIAGGRACDLAASVLEYYRSPQLRSDTARWGRLFVENEWSHFSAYRRFFLAMRQAGFLQRMGGPPKISFLPHPGCVPEPRLASTSRPIDTRPLGAPEGPFPEHDLPEFRWALGPATAFQIEALEDGRHVTAIYYRNLHRNQVVTVETNGRICGEFPLDETGMRQNRMLMLELELRHGMNDVKLSFTKWGGPVGDERPLAIILTRFQLASSTVFEPLVK